jgi:N-acetylneuraminate synthase
MSVYIIAEAGVNHNGSIERAHELVDVAANAGANAVKFQTFKASDMVVEDAPKANYQMSNNSSTETQHDMLLRLELAHESHSELRDHAESRNMEFLSSAFDYASLEFLTDTLGLKTMKVSSGELTNQPFLYAHACKGLNMIVSTGMSTLDEVQTALSVIAAGFLVAQGTTTEPCPELFAKAFSSSEGQQLLKQKVTLLHCTSEYPTSINNVNLRVMNTLADSFGLSVGYSDHTLGTQISGLAVAAGASMLEKHFTVDKSLPGPDQKMSLNPDELLHYVQNAREAELALGVSKKYVSEGEGQNRKVSQKKLVARKLIRAGEVFSSSNIGFKRVGDVGMESGEYWNLLGKTAANDIDVNSAITRQCFK